MNEIRFSCPHCTQHIVCDASYAGQRTNCPNCQRGLVVPHPLALEVCQADAATTPPTEHSTAPPVEPWTDEDWNRHLTRYYRLRLLSLAGGSRLGYWFWGFSLGPLLLFLSGVAIKQALALDFLSALGNFLLGGLLPDDISGSTKFWLNPLFYLFAASAGVSGLLLATISARKTITRAVCGLVFACFILVLDLFVCCFGGWATYAGSSLGGK